MTLGIPFPVTYVFLCGLQISLKISSYQYAREEVGVGVCAGLV